MSREIKFRVWYGDEMVPLGMAIKDEIVSYDFQDYYIQSEYDDMPLMQYTGLKDKNGKEIYEGDIVKFEHWDERIVDDDDVTQYSEDAQVTEVQSRGIIKGDFEECTMWLIDWAMDSDYVFEIIGNIYENPELIS